MKCLKTIIIMAFACAAITAAVLAALAYKEELAGFYRRARQKVADKCPHCSDFEDFADIEE